MTFRELKGLNNTDNYCRHNILLNSWHFLGVGLWVNCGKAQNVNVKSLMSILSTLKCTFTEKEHYSLYFLVSFTVLTTSLLPSHKCFRKKCHHKLLHYCYFFRHPIHYLIKYNFLQTVDTPTHPIWQLSPAFHENGFIIITVCQRIPWSRYALWTHC